MDGKIGRPISDRQKNGQHHRLQLIDKSTDAQKTQ